MKKLPVLVCGLALALGWICWASGAPKYTWKPTKVQVAAARKIGQPVIITNSIGMKFVLIPAGRFMMGTPVHMIEGAGDLPRSMPDEAPQHRVKISRSFYMQATEVTQAQFFEIMGRNPSHHKKCDRCPVEHVSWLDAREFVRRLNAREKTDKYRLPTEAEWEYAYRATTITDYYCGDSDDCFKDYEWCDATSGGHTHPVGLKKPNQWGVFDLACNVPEWCSDWYAYDFYKKSPLTDPKGPASGRKRVVRGGQFDTPYWFNTAAHRDSCAPSDRTEGFGFRVVRQAP